MKERSSNHDDGGGSGSTNNFKPRKNKSLCVSLLWRGFCVHVVGSWSSLVLFSMFDLLNSCSVLRLSLLRPLKRFGCTYELLRRWWWIMDSIFLSLWLFSAHRMSVEPALYRSNGIFNWAFECLYIVIFFSFSSLFRLVFCSFHSVLATAFISQWQINLQ